MTNNSKKEKELSHALKALFHCLVSLLSCMDWETFQSKMCIIYNFCPSIALQIEFILIDFNSLDILKILFEYIFMYVNYSKPRRKKKTT